MNATLYTSGAGGGKTTFAIQQLLEAEAQNFGAESWVLLPTRLQQETFRERLIQTAGSQERSAVFNIRFYNFYDLYSALLDLAAQPQRTLSPAAVDRILRHQIDKLHTGGGLNYYEPIAAKAGFVGLIRRFIEELKQSLIEDTAFSEAAAMMGEKSQELARIYSAYQAFLTEQKLVDRDGAGWVALTALEDQNNVSQNNLGQTQPKLAAHVGLLVVDGFDNFSRLQARLLAALAAQVQQTSITLTYEAKRGQDAHWGFAQTRERLEKLGFTQQTQLKTPPELGRTFALAHLERRLFTFGENAQPANDDLFWIEAPSPAEEVRAVLRWIKALILDGAAPESILITMRDANQYADLLRSTAAAYGLPLLLRQAELVADNPALRAVLALLDLHRLDFPRRHLLDMLHSPYLSPPELDTEAINQLERISLSLPIVGGREAWLAGLQYAATLQPLPTPEDDDPDTLDSNPNLAEGLARLFDRITPPPQASASDYVRWIEALLGPDPATQEDDQADAPTETSPLEQHFNLYGNIRQQAADAVIVRDLYALHGLRSALRSVLGAYDLLNELLPSAQARLITWNDFRADLDLALAKRPIPDEARHSRRGRVLATNVYEARGLPHEHVIILGLSEGQFPKRQAQDALYGDTERQNLKDRHGLELILLAKRSRDAGLFYEACALAGESLTLSRPTLDAKGNELAPSIFWKTVEHLLPGGQLTRLRAGKLPAPQESASLRELTLSLSHNMNQAAPPMPIIRALAWLILKHPELWARIRAGQAIELARESRHSPFNTYSGLLQHPALIGRAAEHLHADYLWSASQLRELAACPFGFFSKRLLKLEPYKEPEIGLDALQLGSLNHEILENTYKRIGAAGLAIAPENQARAIAILEECAAEVFKTAPQKFKFVATSFCRKEEANLLKRLRLLIERDFSEDHPLKQKPFELDGQRYPYQQEAAFGFEGQAPITLLGLGGLVKVRGFIDRVDLIDGRYLLVMDYKSGTHTPSNRDLENGRDFQMLLYLRAAEQVLAKDRNLQVLGGLFWSIRRNETGGAILADAPELENAHDHLHHMVNQARQGQFPNQPAKLEEGKCSRFCELSQLCRINRNSPYKPLS